MLSFTVDNLIGIAIGFVTLATFGAGFYKFMDTKLENVRREASQRLESVRTEFAMDILRMEAAYNGLRGECARRDEVKRLEDGIVNLNQRIDRLTEVLLAQFQAKKA